MSLAAETPSPQFPSGTPSPTPSPLAVHRDPPASATRDVVLPRPIEPPTAKRVRLASLDVFRGMTIAMMVLVNNEGNDHAYSMLDHAPWNGWTPTDLVFPFFLFIVGVAIPFSLSRRGEVATRGQLIGRIWSRALSLVLLGLLLAASSLPLPWLNVPVDGFHFIKAMRWVCFVFSYASIFALVIPWKWPRFAMLLPVVIAITLIALAVTMHFVRIQAVAHGWNADDFGKGGLFNPDFMRIPGVLQRIGICYGVAATIALFAGWRTVLLSAMALCTLYLVLMFKVPAQGHALAALDKDENFSRTVDVAVFERSHLDPDGKRVWTQKHTWRDYPDNEGIVSTLPAIATALFGVLAGFWLRRPVTAVERCAGLLAVAGPVIFLGIVLDHALMPINKILWTPSFSVFCAGMAMLVLGTVFWLCDVLGRRLWAWPFTVMGMNAIAAFVASSLVLRIASFFPRFKLNDGKKGQFNTYANQHIQNGVQQASNWLHAHAPRLPVLDTLQNESLAYSLAFVLVIFLLMWVLYVCRIFVKV